MLAGCHFAVVPPKNHAASATPRSCQPVRRTRLADAPALLAQCAVDTAGLRPGPGLDWFSDGQVTIAPPTQTTSPAGGHAHDKPGPYPQTFVIAGHRTHYLEFGTPWVKRGSLWVPANTGNTNQGAALLADRLDELDRGQRQAASAVCGDGADRAAAADADFRERHSQSLVIPPRPP